MSSDIAKPFGKRKRGRPLIEERGNTLEALKPWDALGMSRRSWYRRQSLRPGKHSLERLEKAIEGL
jgi:hypothetical protein